MKALLIEQAAVKGLKLGGAPGNKCGSLRYLSHAVDPRALETAINQTVAEATISGLAL